MGGRRATVARILLGVATLPALLGLLLVPWTVRTAMSGGHGGTVTVRQCTLAAIGWSCTGIFNADDGMACDGEPGCPTWAVVLDDPSRRVPGQIVWSTKTIGENVAHPWGWREQELLPLVIFAGVLCYGAAVATVIRRRPGLATSVTASLSIALLVPVAVWLVST